MWTREAEVTDRRCGSERPWVATPLGGQAPAKQTTPSTQWRTLLAQEHVNLSLTHLDGHNCCQQCGEWDAWQIRNSAFSLAEAWSRRLESRAVFELCRAANAQSHIFFPHQHAWVDRYRSLHILEKWE
jgi:hypothetical protein